jgi:hypothetical protein
VADAAPGVGVSRAGEASAAPDFEAEDFVMADFGVADFGVVAFEAASAFTDPRIMAAITPIRITTIHTLIHIPTLMVTRTHTVRAWASLLVAAGFGVGFVTSGAGS